MRRIAITCLAAAVLLTAAFLLFFTTSKFNRGSNYFTNLSDFSFMLQTHYHHALSRPIPPLTPNAYLRVMRRVHRGAHWEVKRAALVWLSAWGETAVPYLLSELGPHTDWQRMAGAAKALGRIGSADALDPMADMLFNPPAGMRFPPRLKEALVEAIGQIGGETAADILIDYFEAADISDKPGDSTMLEALAHSGAGAAYLLNHARQARDDDELYRMLWALAYTRDPGVARFLAQCLRHLDGGIRQRARDAMDQVMGPVAVDPALDILMMENDDYVRYAIVNMILAGRDARGNPRAIRQLSLLLEDPVLGQNANYALTRIGGPEAAAALMALKDKYSPRSMMDNLQALGADAVPGLSGYLQDPDPWTRGQALDKLMALRLPQTRPLVKALVEDPHPRVRSDAFAALLRMDKIDLQTALAHALPDAMGRGMRHGFRPTHNRGFRNVWKLFTWLHWASTLMAAVVGLLLLTGTIREFEPYRFHIVLQFLLLEGFVGDFFFMDKSRGDPWAVYMFATGCHLLLLMGNLMKGRDRLPGQAQNRYERVGGMSLWVLVPLILWFGTPLIASSLRHALALLPVMLWAVAGLAVLAALLFEQWLIPWHLWRPREGARRTVRAVTGVGVALLPLWALFIRIRNLWWQQDGDGVAWCFILMLPLMWMAIHSVFMLMIGSIADDSAPIGRAPTRRLRLVREREQRTVEIDLRWRNRWKWIAMQGLLLVGPAAAAAVTSARGGNGPAMVLALTSALFGPAVAGLFWDMLPHRILIQVRNGYIRCGIPILGGVFSGGRWHRRLAIAPHLRSRLGLNLSKKNPNRPFSAAEQSWLDRVSASDGPRSRESEVRS